MHDFSSLEGVAKAIGVPANRNGIRGAGRARNYTYAFPFNFTAIAAGGSQTVSQKISSAAAFIASACAGVLHDGAGAAVATSRLVTVEVSSNDGQYQQSAIPWDAIVGTAVQPFFFLFKPVFAPGANVAVTIRNGTAAAITGALVFHGHQLGIDPQ